MKQEFITRDFGKATVNRTIYADGNIAVQLLTETGAPLAMLSVNVPQCQHMLEVNEFFAKTWSENCSIAEDALRSGLFVATLKEVTLGFVKAPVWKFVAPPAPGSERTWKVKYQHRNDRETRHPFFKREINVKATSRKDAIAKVQAYVGSNTYDKFSAAPTEEAPSSLVS